jgi:hypothetical protein
MTGCNNAYVAIITYNHVFFIEVAANDLFFQKFEDLPDIFKSQLIPEIIKKTIVCNQNTTKCAVKF